MPQDDSSPQRGLLQAYAVCYGLFIVLLALSILAFFVWRAAVLALIAAFAARDAVNDLLYLGPMLLIAIVLFLFVMAGETYLRNGVERRQVQRRFVRFATPLVVAIVVAVILRLLALSRLA